MAIEIVCECCKSTIKVRNELAGRTGSCRQCGSSITIPKPSYLLINKLLGDATPEEMIQELNRRRQKVVMLLLKKGQASSIGGYQLGGDQQLSLETLGTQGFDQQQLAAIFSHLANAAEQRAEAHKAIEDEAEKDVFALKGDELGMSIGDFKKKYVRKVECNGKMAPWCSDEQPGQRVKDLLSEPWHASAGLVHARIDYPEEDNSPTIAGAATKAVIYQFLDNQLFQITAFFSPESFHEVSSALMKKFGEPQSEQVTPRSLQWWSMASTINLKQGTIRPPEPTILSYYHDELVKQAGQRKPDRTADL